MPPGEGNISDDPQLTDGLHIGVNSPCRGAGVLLPWLGTDINGDVWRDPPTIGCDEVLETGMTGPLAVTIDRPPYDPVAGCVSSLAGRVTGMVSRLVWDFGDGAVATNASCFTSHVWTNPGNYLVTLTAFNNDHPAGVSANVPIQVVQAVARLVSDVRMEWGDSWGYFVFQFPGQAGVDYVVEYTTNLTPPIRWFTLTSHKGDGGTVQVADLVTSDAARFYRIRTQ